MQNILIKGGLWIIKQEWFQFAVIKFITNTIEKSETKKDDALLAFIKRNKRSITSVINKEVISSAVIDKRLQSAIKSLNS